MKYITIPGSSLKFSQISLGTMRIQRKEKDANGNKIYVGKSVEEVELLLKTALDLGINVIDTADIYGHGLSEELIGKVIAKCPELRKKMILQTKCGVVSTSEGLCYDASKDYILKCVDESLERLQTNYIDVLLLHKPDPLYDPKQIAEAFETLRATGKVLYFGVSNFTPVQTALIQKYCSVPIVFSQMQFSIAHSLMIDEQVSVNTNNIHGTPFTSGILDYCRYNDICLQAYSVAQGTNGTFINNPEYEKLNKVMDTLCEKYNTNKNAIALAWILKHPANIMPIIGTTNPAHIKDSLEAFNFELTRQEWYDLYTACDKPLP
ncbi:aldo/keto reductase [Breznakia pachnodae]|uniref:Oxidoreductase n=1 Tax=Breznakia pachnodae TaxID=265178 RepID=A0ABU0E3J3_9FIRM|nr:aldo/keto reductase [Breznakia pachnodae]MDQ0361472.1 putative oxidoreductase [Breznakia pachnodae]